jgi:hypothetical protein
MVERPLLVACAWRHGDRGERCSRTGTGKREKGGERDMTKDNVQTVIEEISGSMNRFLKVASVAELFVFAIFMGALAGVVQGVGHIVAGGFRTTPRRNIRIG